VSAASAKVTMRGVLGAALVLGFMAALTLLFWVAIPKQNEQLVTYMLGQLSGFVGAVVAFHYTMNALNEKATANTGDALRAITATAQATGSKLPEPVPSFAEGPAFGQDGGI
jgi:apolipoprotein N-acyltransferase